MQIADFVSTHPNGLDGAFEGDSNSISRIRRFSEQWWPAVVDRSSSQNLQDGSNLDKSEGEKIDEGKSMAPSKWLIEASRRIIIDWEAVRRRREAKHRNKGRAADESY